MTRSLPAELRCPRCRGSLAGERSALRCLGCDAGYPIVAEIADLRVCADPYLDLEGDRAKALALAERSPRSSFEALVRQYWEMTPSTPPPAAERYVDYALRAEERGRSALELLGAGSGRLLDLGTGTGGLLAAAADFSQRVGVDVALRWLVVARKRLEERGVQASLLCACADHLPFAAGAFDCVAGLDLLPHCAHPTAAGAEAARVLTPGGQALFTVANRYSLLPDPHTGLVGAGFLPRAWSARYVAWRGRRFDPNIHPLGAAAAARIARGFFRRVEITLPHVGPAERSRLRPPDRRRALIYERLRRIPLFRPWLRAFGPFFALLCAEPVPESAP